MELRQRKQLRMKSYDYAQNGAYYVTICTHNRNNLFCTVDNVGAHPCVRPNKAGLLVEKRLHSLEEKFSDVSLDYYCIMPNHIHFILIKYAETGAHTGTPLQEILQWFKTQTTNDYIKLVKKGELKPFDKHVWQRNYFEHVIRCENDLYEIRRYIEENPLKWILDKYYKKDF